MSQNFPVFDRSVGGNQSALAIGAAAVINPKPCHCWTVCVIAPGTAGVLTLNDAASLGGANSSNEIFSIPYSQLAVGQLILLKGWPIQAGIVVSAVPTGGVVNVAYSYAIP